jgi:hypothetical protein
MRIPNKNSGAKRARSVNEGYGTDDDMAVPHSKRKKRKPVNAMAASATSPEIFVFWDRGPSRALPVAAWMAARAAGASRTRVKSTTAPSGPDTIG